MTLSPAQRLVLAEVFKRWLRWEFVVPAMREMVARPYYLSNGQPAGELLYHDPEALR